MRVLGVVYDSSVEDAQVVILIEKNKISRLEECVFNWVKSRVG